MAQFAALCVSEYLIYSYIRQVHWLAMETPEPETAHKTTRERGDEI